jgi:acetyl esterase/lipase
VEVERLVGGVLELERDPAVRADRIALVGLSVGGSLAIAAASDERIAERVWFVLAIGPYFDAASLAASALAGAYRAGDGGIEPWAPERVTLEVVRETLLEALTPAERDALEGVDLEGAEAVLAGLAPALRASLEAISPRYAVEGLRAPLYLLHDRDDRFVPWTESEALAAAHEPAVYHRMELFEHVDPDAGNLPVLARDGWRLMRLFARIFREAR